MVALTLIEEEVRCHRVLGDLHPRTLRRPGYGRISIGDHQLLAEGIDEVLGTSCDDDAIGGGRGEAHRIPDEVAIEPPEGRDHEGVVSILLYLPQWDGADMPCYRALGAVLQLVHGDELVEYSVVKHQQHAALARVVLYGEEAFAGIVGLLVAHPWRGDELAVDTAVGAEADASVEEDLQLGP